MKTKILRHLECGVCLETFDNPICLDCGHVFCLDCILDVQKVAKDSKLKYPACPCCRKQFKPKKRFY